MKKNKLLVVPLLLSLIGMISCDGNTSSSQVPSSQTSSSQTSSSQTSSNSLNYRFNWYTLASFASLLYKVAIILLLASNGNKINKILKA